MCIRDRPLFRFSTLTLQPVLRLVRNPCYALPFFCLFFLSAILWQQVGYLPSASCTALHSLQFPWRIQSLLQGQLGFKLVCGAVSYTHLDVYKRQPINTAPAEIAISICNGTTPRAVVIPSVKSSAPAVVRNTR